MSTRSLASSTPPGAQVQDFDLHGIVGVRVVDASPEDISTIRRQLGPLESELDREPDITIRFVDSVGAEHLTLVGIGESGFDDDRFFLLRGRDGVAGRASIPFDSIGHGVEIVCERKLPAVPHLVAIINLTALAKGVLPLHAAAFTHRSMGVMVTGWSKGGKTEALLGSMSAGAQYVGDEWVYITDDGQLHGLPEPIRIWSWQFEQLPALLRGRQRPERRKLGSWRRLAGIADAASRSSLPGAGIARRAQPILARQAYLQVPPEELFGSERIAPRARLDVVVLVMSHDDPATLTRPVDATEVAHRMEASLEEERAPLMTHYRQFRYAFPDRTNPVIETAGELENKLLSAVLDSRPCVKVQHPHPCDIDLLGRTVLASAEAALDASTADGAKDRRTS